MAFWVRICVILIDGLDAFQDSNAVENCFVSSLAAAVRNLPPWVRWVLTSREDPSVMQKLQGLVPQVALDKCGHQTRDDMLKYLQLALVQFVANADKNVPAATLRFIVERSEGLFLYASHIVNALSQKRLTLDKLESFPVGMGGVRPLLEVLCAAFEPLHMSTLHDIMKWDLAKTERSIECMQKFSSDENFQLARRLARLRDSGLERY
ncbi:hypothetical protein DYB25_002490 [Aphanomyces astaci]|uniref:NACHT domain-containing protein n=1 Tax=Aphanomyces astaci TaxID=112090 RepID=A0A397B185_APHAT|nr:hypothetical protein DYB25_002490 [Aphanomyces astaci]